LNYDTLGLSNCRCRCVVNNNSRIYEYSKSKPRMCLIILIITWHSAWFIILWQVNCESFKLEFLRQRRQCFVLEWRTKPSLRLGSVLQTFKILVVSNTCLRKSFAQDESVCLASFLWCRVFWARLYFGRKTFQGRQPCRYQANPSIFSVGSGSGRPIKRPYYDASRLKMRGFTTAVSKVSVIDRWSDFANCREVKVLPK
jgi:hypothetical protein